MKSLGELFGVRVYECRDFPPGVAGVVLSGPIRFRDMKIVKRGGRFVCEADVEFPKMVILKEEG